MYNCNHLKNLCKIVLESSMFYSPKTQWEKILEKPFEKQIKFFNKVCKVNQRDALVIREAFFNNLSFPLVKKILKLARKIINEDLIDRSFEELIFDRLLGVSGVAHLYPEDKEFIQEEGNIIFGEGYFVYTACYHDLDKVIEFISSHIDIKSVCDLGSGSGRALLYMALQIDRELDFLGLEIVEDRVNFTNSLVNNFGLTNITFKASDFLETPNDFFGYDAYYLYDPVGTDDVPLLISHFEKMIADGLKFYILFLSGWDDLMYNALNQLDSLKQLHVIESQKQENRVLSFYKVI